ncbi:MAG: S8 family serine peptidase [Sphingobacteriaceae bacterium]|nr:S8 family serine peptidase [Sphingobacteriaceae bacterium]
MKRLLSVALMTACACLATAFVAYAQNSVLLSSQAPAAPRTEASSEIQSVFNKSNALELPILQQLEDQTGMFKVSNTAQLAAFDKGDPTDRVALAQLAARFQSEYRAAQQLLLSKTDVIPMTQIVSGNTIAQYKSFNGNAAPLFYVTSNVGGAQTISTHKVWPGGLSGLSLSGQGIPMGEWDGGAVRVSHQEFGGRVTMADGANILNSHATHVAATMIGAGTDPLAKGMAYQGVLNAYDWSNDEAEMANAASAGMLLSNHSYGIITGWYFGNIENTGDNWYWFGSTTGSVDENYGRYSIESRDWDLIAASAPNYLIVKAAGNDRNYGPAAGTSHRVWNGSVWVNSSLTREKAGGTSGFDCISHAGVSKNVLTVGAVQGISGGYTNASQVISSSFHGWGPTDDGRIKPDLVAKGVQVYSATATSNTSYDSWNGTSMASPTVTGSLALLQQRHKQLYSDNIMRAATLKAIAIHTADEAGTNPGPDYVYGWGLMNTAKASDVVARKNGQHDFVEASLANGATYTYNLYTDGTAPLKATLSWTDPAAPTAPYILNGTTSNLINNLDVRIIRLSDSTQFQPWVLNPANPAAAATSGDNNRDNVEQILLNNPTPGNYLVRVSHKGSLASAQHFSLVVSGLSTMPVNRNVTFRVNMTGINVSPLGVHIAGSFQNPVWNPGSTSMINAGNNVWEHTASIPEGTSVEYKFINGNAWGSEEQVPSACNFNNSGNRGLVVPTSDVVLPAVIYGQCNTSLGPLVAVTFQVDMTGQVIRSTGVHMAGNFQGWNPANSPMTAHPTLPNVYTYTAQIAAGTAVEYKFVNGNDWGFLDTTTGFYVDYSEVVPAACAIGPNRHTVVPSTATVLPAYLFGNCNVAGSQSIFTDAIRSRGFSSAVVVGSHTSGANFVSKGVVYGQNPAPTLANMSVVDSSTGNSIYAAISNLLPATQYYARTFVTDSAGQTTFGNQILFRTFAALGTHPARITFDITDPATAAGSYGYGLGAGASSLWNYEIDTIAVQGPLVVGRAAQSDSLGCDGTLMNTAELKGKIVVLYRGACEFGLKALSAQRAGAVGVIIVNNQPGLINMSGGVNGANVTIPVVMISAFDGVNLRPMIDNGLVRAFIGNKFGGNNLDLVIGSGDVIKPLAFALPLNLVSQPGDYVVDLGAQVQNIGLSSTSFNLNVQVWRNGSSQDVVYFQNVSGASIGLGQSHVAVTAPFDLSVLGIGNHRIRYEVLPSIGSDEGPADNVYFQDLRITQDLYAASSLNGSGGLNIFGNGNRPSVAGPYTVGNWFKAPQAGRMKVSELKFSYTATAPTVLTNQLIEGAVYRWDDLDSNGFVEVNEMTQVGRGDYLYPDNGISQERSMLMFDNVTNQPGVTLTNGARYLFAVTYTGFAFEVFANTDPLSNYIATNNYTGEPTTAVFSSNGVWSTNGFGSQTVFTIAAVMVPQSATCQATLVAQGNTNLCLDQFVTLTVNSGDPINFVEWFVNGRFIPQVNGTNVDARSDGEYVAVVHFINGCIDTTNSINVVVTMPHQANVNVNGPLHYQAGQAVNTNFSTVPQQLLTLNLQGSPVRQLPYRNVLASSGWINVPQGTAANFTGDVVIARDGSVGDSLACGPITGTSLQGKVAMVFRGACPISDKALNAQRAGAIAVIVVNNGINQFIPSFITNPLTGDSVTIPVLIISNESGMELAELIGSMSGVSLAFAPATSAAYTYSWLLNDLPIAGANGNSYTATTTGDYRLYVETAGGNCAYLSGYLPVSQSSFTQSPWSLQNLNQPIANQIIRNIEPVSNSTAWALGDKSTNTGLLQNFYRTTDGGNNWNAGSIPNTTQLGTSHIMAFDEQIAFVTLFGDSASQGLYKTVDGGNSWNRLNVFNNGGFPNFSHFWNQNEGVVVGDPNQLTGAWEIYRTTNGGNTWQMVTNIPMPFAFDEYGTTATMSVAPNGNMYWPTVGGRLFVTNNQGLSWTTRNLPAGGGQYYIAFTDSGQGAAYHAPTSKLYVTNDDGFSWMQLPRPYGGLANILSMAYVPNANNLILMVSGPLGTAYLENNVNWSNIDGEYHGAVKFIGPSVGWSGGLSANNGQGGVWKWNSQVFGGNQPTGTVGGQVRYANNAQTPMSNTYVIAYNALDHTIRDAVQTDANGNYLFTNAPVGNYILRASTTKPWGGVNATDALRIARHFTSLQPLTGLRLQAADVNANNVINSTDALQVAQRFTGLLNNPNYLRVYFDALLGGNLAQTTSIHMHSGASIDPNFGWQYVVGDWGNPASPGQMTSLGNGKWSLAMNPVAYFNQAPNGPMPAGSSIDNIGMVFRESGPCGGSGVPCLEQKDGIGEDIYIYPWLNPPASSYLGVKAALSTPTGFAAGDWIFNEASVQVLEGQLTTINLQGICVGDVDGSYNPGNVRLAPKVALVNDGDLLATSNKLVKLPIRIENGAHLGAMSLKLHYNAAQLQPVALKLMNAALEHQTQVNIANGVISFGWFDLGGWIVANDQVILELEAYVLVNGVNQFDIWVGEGSEFADEVAQPLHNTKLLMPGLRSQNIPTSNALSLNNYPNPFRHETTIAFELPEAGRVKMIVTDVTGRAITELELGDRSAGKHEHSFEGAALSAGVYFCELQVQGATRQEKAIIRMIIK